MQEMWLGNMGVRDMCGHEGDMGVSERRGRRMVGVYTGATLWPPCEECTQATI